MTRLLVTAAPSADEPPVLFAAAVWSVLLMTAVFVSVLLVYLLRHRIERANILVQGMREHEYFRSVQQPVVAVLLAAVGGYGINTATQEVGWPGYLGWVLGMPIPAGMATWAAIHSVRQRRFDEQWPPDDIPADNPVRIRSTLRRVVRHDADAEQPDPAALDRALALLLDQVLPALRQRRDRGPGRWLREHGKTTTVVLGWAVATLAATAVAAFPHLVDRRRSAWLFLAAATLVIGFLAVGLLTLLYRHSRYQSTILADEVQQSAGAVRRRIVERRLGIAAPGDGGQRRRRRPPTHDD
ncbi:hypothetical protein [Micromonospora sp. WMMD987]|uniref:hypothetical protein n=1 Tax=Micromonospora sp. WMMD987 TaxID=3016089 RepID=UPI002499E00A|nr:hypothetical protein [Micromonospora sp. WMMD987]WFE97501.1 hypothetical protein O7612_11790 [Micromonospora sp. WMMD987]